MKRSFHLFVLYLLLTGFTQAQISEKQAIEFTKRLSPSVLDSTLPQGRLSDWLTRILGKGATVTWELNDCGEQTGDPAIDSQRDLPACVGIYVTFADGRKLGITVLVGTAKKGIVDNPVVFDIYFASDGKTRTIKRLSDLPNALVQSSR